LEQLISDRELVVKTLNGSVNGFEQLIERYSRKLYLFIFNRTGNREDTEDIIQETFLKAYKSLSAYDPGWEFSTWIYTIASRTATSHFRYKNVRENKPIFPLKETTTPEEEMMKGNIDSIWKAAAELGPAKREILRLRYGDGLSIKEIGKITGKSAANIRVLLYRAKNELIRIMNSVNSLSDALKNDPEKSMT